MILLSGDPILPDPTIDFDVNNYTLVDELTYESDLVVVTGVIYDAYAPPGALSAQAGSTWDAVRDAVKSERDAFVATIHDRILAFGRVKAMAVAMVVSLANMNQSSQGVIDLLDPGDPDRVGLEQDVAVRNAKKAGLNTMITFINSEIMYLGDLRSMINDDYDRMLPKIKPYYAYDDPEYPALVEYRVEAESILV